MSPARSSSPDLAPERRRLGSGRQSRLSGSPWTDTSPLWTGRSRGEAAWAVLDLAEPARATSLHSMSAALELSACRFGDGDPRPERALGAFAAGCTLLGLAPCVTVGLGTRYSMAVALLGHHRRPSAARRSACHLARAGGARGDRRRPTPRSGRRQGKRAGGRTARTGFAWKIVAVSAHDERATRGSSRPAPMPFARRTGSGRSGGCWRAGSQTSRGYSQGSRRRYHQMRWGLTISRLRQSS